MFKVATIFAFMKILLCSATEGELSNLREIEVNSQEIDFLVTGIGMVATTYSLTRQFAAAEYDLALQIGLAGSFDSRIKIGGVCRIEEDVFSELGAESGNDFLTLEQMDLPGITTVKNEIDFDSDMLNALPVWRGITVNTVHGNETSIAKIKERLNPQVETMEGAAFLWACNQTKVKCVQIRSISNYVEKRDKSKWEIGLAVKNLNDTLVRIMT